MKDETVVNKALDQDDSDITTLDTNQGGIQKPQRVTAKRGSSNKANPARVQPKQKKVNSWFDDYLACMPPATRAAFSKPTV